METYSFAATVYMDVPDRRFFLCKNHGVQGATLPKKNGHDHKVNLLKKTKHSDYRPFNSSKLSIIVYSR